MSWERKERGVGCQAWFKRGCGSEWGVRNGNFLERILSEREESWGGAGGGCFVPCCDQASGSLWFSSASLLALKPRECSSLPSTLGKVLVCSVKATFHPVFLLSFSSFSFLHISNPNILQCPDQMPFPAYLPLTPPTLRRFSAPEILQKLTLLIFCHFNFHFALLLFIYAFYLLY